MNLLNRLIELGAAGFRIDAALHVWPNDLEIIYNRMNNLKTEFGFAANSRPFIYQEVVGFWKLVYCFVYHILFHSKFFFIVKCTEI